MTPDEKEILNHLYTKHRNAIHALYDFLRTDKNVADFEEGLPSAAILKEPYRVKIAENQIVAGSIPELYLKVLKLLHEKQVLHGLESKLPISTGAKQFLLAKEPKHPTGKEFFKPVEFEGFFMEANKSRETGLAHLKRLVETECGLAFKVVKSDLPPEKPV